MYNKEVQTAGVEMGTLTEEVEEDQERIQRERDAEAERLALENDIEAESIQLEKEIEEEIKGGSHNASLMSSAECGIRIDGRGAGYYPRAT